MVDRIREQFGPAIRRLGLLGARPSATGAPSILGCGLGHAQSHAARSRVASIAAPCRRQLASIPLHNSTATPTTSVNSLRWARELAIESWHGVMASGEDWRAPMRLEAVRPSVDAELQTRCARWRTRRNRFRLQSNHAHARRRNAACAACSGIRSGSSTARRRRAPRRSLADARAQAASPVDSRRTDRLRPSRGSANHRPRARAARGGGLSAGLAQSETVRAPAQPATGRPWTIDACGLAGLAHDSRAVPRASPGSRFDCFQMAPRPPRRPTNGPRVEIPSGSVPPQGATIVREEAPPLARRAQFLGQVQFQLPGLSHWTFRVSPGACLTRPLEPSIGAFSILAAP